MEIHESAEDYLETILRLQQRQGQVRSIDVVTEMNFSKPSVSVAMKKLRESGHVQMDENGLLTLTEDGLAVAQRIYERHQVIAAIFMALGVPVAEKLNTDNADRHAGGPGRGRAHRRRRGLQNRARHLRRHL